MFRHGLRREIVSVWRWLWQYRRFWRKGTWCVRWWARHFIMSGSDSRAFSHNLHKHGYMGTRPCDGSCEEGS